MQEFDMFVVARSLHVAAVVFWIGGVAFVTTVLIPAIIKMQGNGNKVELFETIENRFSLQAKITTLITGVSGFYMLFFMDAWDRYLQLQFWWLHLMTLVWILFTLVLFVFEPLFLHRWFHRQADKDSDGTILLLHRMHIILLLISVVAVTGAVAGSHGFRFY